MRIIVRSPGVEASDPFREHVVRRVHAHLSRFGNAVTSVVVRIADVNGPKGGVDKSCHVTLRGPALGAVTIGDQRAEAHAAVAMALERAAHAAGRALERARAFRRDGRARQRALGGRPRSAGDAPRWPEPLGSTSG